MDDLLACSPHERGGRTRAGVRSQDEEVEVFVAGHGGDARGGRPLVEAEPQGRGVRDDGGERGVGVLTE